MREIITEGMTVPLKAWDTGVPMEPGVIVQLSQVCQLPFVFRHAALMPDGHVGIGASVGTVVATKKAIVPAIAGVDLGCGVGCVKTTLKASDIPDSGQKIYDAIMKAVPVGTPQKNQRDNGSWQDSPDNVKEAWEELEPQYRSLVSRHGKISSRQPHLQLGTLGSSNHFLSVNIDKNDNVWFMLHSGSRNAGNLIGQYFIEKARKDMERQDIRLPNRDLAYFEEGSEYFKDYVEAIEWAQNYARINRELMMENMIRAIKKITTLPSFKITDEAVNCHHNYVSVETHFGEEVFVTRKGAVSAKEGQLGIIPSAMGGKNFIVRGKGNPESFHSCSHGAGRVMSRTKARETITLTQHKEATEGIICRKDKDVIDESPAAYKNVEAVIAAQTDLIDVVHELKEIIVVKG